MRLSRSIISSLILTTMAFAQSPSTQPAAAPTTSPADVADVKAAIAAYNAAVESGDIKTLSSSIAVTTPVQKQAIDLMGTLTKASRGLYQAAVDTYGKDSLAKNNVAKEAFPSGYPSIPAEAQDIKVTGDKATVSVGTPDGPPPLAMIKKDGAWKIDGDALLPPMTDKQMTEQRTVIDAAIAAIDDTATDVKAGHFKGPDEALAIMNFRVQKAVRQAQMKLMPLEAPTTEPTTQAATEPTPTPMP
ncbi:MAG: hypothetical protein ACTHM6_11515 [Tepidisphaeraceae bacterium]